MLFGVEEFVRQDWSGEYIMRYDDIIYSYLISIPIISCLLMIQNIMTEEFSRQGIWWVSHYFHIILDDLIVEF